MVSYDHLWSAIWIYGDEPYVPFDRKDGLSFRDLAGVVLNQLVKELGQRIKRIEHMKSIKSEASVDRLFKE